MSQGVDYQEETPPPWAYDVPDYLTMGVSGREVHGFEKYPYPSAAFKSQSAKCSLHNFVKTSGDPGQYDPVGPKKDTMQTRCTSLNRHHKDGRAAFGSTQKRNEPFAMAARSTGSLSYDYEHLYAVGRSSSPRRGLKAPTPRFGKDAKALAAEAKERREQSRRLAQLASAEAEEAAKASEVALREARDAEAEADFLDEFGDDAAKFAARAAADAAKATAEEAEREARAAAQRSEMLRSEARVSQAERKEDTRTASFRSASPSARSYIRPSPTPGVGSYDPHDSPNKVRTRRSHHNFKPGTSACTMPCIAMYNPMVYSACYLLAICSLSACQPRRLYIPHASLSCSQVRAYTMTQPTHSLSRAGSAAFASANVASRRRGDSPVRNMPRYNLYLHW